VRAGGNGRGSRRSLDLTVTDLRNGLSLSNASGGSEEEDEALHFVDGLVVVEVKGLVVCLRVD